MNDMIQTLLETPEKAVELKPLIDNVAAAIEILAPIVEAHLQKWRRPIARNLWAVVEAMMEAGYTREEAIAMQAGLLGALRGRKGGSR